jgi:hypothetical protein
LADSPDNGSGSAVVVVSQICSFIVKDKGIFSSTDSGAGVSNFWDGSGSG